ncbi:NADH-quinone oxidoreductase subunit M [Candidatus Erwinia haradaeae]|uniref:NADH-quinone oxidoreductase subunit M n=1 Tax=Candidatus Erwinia haradaeae TaxID=1922217 RepID=A0A803GC74_9GAMM|nr:NADH-quinone oxidoreductase subunit M [Candidatus Erwinia haradaeae]VFP87251.1 NADH-quinone oxidoreductase subunit M [Candidatus Erwinia haradaeae]
MLLPWLIALPFIGGVFCWYSERLGKSFPRWIALIVMGLMLILSLLLCSHISEVMLQTRGYPQWQLQFFVPWIPRFGINFHLALDGLSLIMIVLTSFIGILAILCSWNEINKSHGFFHFNLLWILSGVIGVFLSIDLFLFLLFWEIMLVPMYLLIVIWGHEDSVSKIGVKVGTKFLIYSQLSGLFMLISISGLALVHYHATGELTFDYEYLLNTPMLPGIEKLLMIGFFIAFAVKMPVVPFHGWLPDTHAQSPTCGSVDLAGILLKTAAYGLLRFVLPLFPHASSEFAPIAMSLGVISIFYGAFVAFSQYDIKRLIAYISISHTGFLLIAIYSDSYISYQGAVIQMVAHSLSVAALFILCGQIYERLNTRDMRNMGGLWSRIKWLPGFSLFFIMANLGIPGTGNFIGEFMILVGSFYHSPIFSVIAALSLIFASVYSLFMMQRIYYGVANSLISLSDMSPREYLMILALVILSLCLGIYPQPILDMSDASIINIHNWLTTAISIIRL